MLPVEFITTVQKIAIAVSDSQEQNSFQNLKSSMMPLLSKPKGQFATKGLLYN